MSLLPTLDAAVPWPLPPWAEALRERGRERFATHGLPHRRLEHWKYTSLKGLEAAPAPVGGTLDRPALLGDGPVVDLIDGAVQALPALADGVSLRPLTEAIVEAGSDLQALLESLPAETPSEALTALNTAELGKGLVLHVSEGTDAGRLLLRWRSGEAPTAAFVNTRLVVWLEPGAKLDLVEDFATEGAVNQILQLRLDRGSELRHARLQDNLAGSWLVTRTEAEQAEATRFEQASLDIGGGLARHDLRARLAGSGAHCRSLGAYLPRGKAHVDHHLDVRHEAVGCESHQLFRGVLEDEGRAVFNGRVHVLPGADDSEAHQSNANLLLSDRAEVDTKPELIIEADEVVASHGATVGQLDEAAVFYLRSRGLDEMTARQVLTGAFCQAVIDEVGNEATRLALRERLATELGTEQ